MKILETLDSCECTSLSHSFIDVIEDLLKISILIDTSLVLLRFHGLLTFWSAYPKKKKKRSGLQPGIAFKVSQPIEASLWPDSTSCFQDIFV